MCVCVCACLQVRAFKYLNVLLFTTIDDIYKPFHIYKSYKLVPEASKYMDVSENSGTPKSSILIGFSIITIHFGVPLFLETPIYAF